MSQVLRYVCKRAAVFSDIHSNYYAFKACVEDAKTQGADCFIFLGDYVSGLANTEQTMDLVYELQNNYPVVCIRGNRERSMLEHHNGISVFKRGSHSGSYFFTYERLREKDFGFFSQLPISTTIEMNGIFLEIAHATAKNDRHYFEDSDACIQDIFQEMKTRYLLTGHSHKQYCCRREGKTIINPGSVGLPQGKDWQAQYALLDLKDSDIICTFRQVVYDIESVIREQFSSGLIACGRCWAICDLYGAIEGKEYTKALLTKIYQRAECDKQVFCDESFWDQCITEMNISFAQEDVWKRFAQMQHNQSK